MMSIMLTQSNIIIQRCKISKTLCCSTFEMLLGLFVSYANRRDRRHKADKSCHRVLAIKKCFATKPWLFQGTERLEIVPLCFVYKDH